MNDAGDGSCYHFLQTFPELKKAHLPKRVGLFMFMSRFYQFFACRT